MAVAGSCWLRQLLQLEASTRGTAATGSALGLSCTVNTQRGLASRQGAMKDSLHAQVCACCVWTGHTDKGKKQHLAMGPRTSRAAVASEASQQPVSRVMPSVQGMQGQQQSSQVMDAAAAHHFRHPPRHRVQRLGSAKAKGRPATFGLDDLLGCSRRG